VVEADRLELAAARQAEADALTLGDVADLGQLEPAGRDRRAGIVHSLAREGGEQLEVLAAHGRQLHRAPAAGDLRHPLGERKPVKVDLDPTAAGGGEVAGVRPEPVREVDHRGGPR
jgi:hypothetical protein